MIYRYLGNKQVVLGALLALTEEYCSPGDHVVDAFSGSLAVSLGFKRAGYRVTSNDVNHFSSTLADAYLLPAGPPAVNADEIVPRRAKMLRVRAAARIAESHTEDQIRELHLREWWDSIVELVSLQIHLETVCERNIPKRFRRTDFFDTYCEDGANSAFVSSRGSIGRRRFFVPENAHRLDLILSQIRMWLDSSALDPPTYAVLLASLLRGVEKVSNTQGTYHDFPRDVWDRRAFNPLKLPPPQWDQWLVSAGGHSRGREQDSLEFIRTVPHHRLLYLDPPYNFRQYTAYYFLLNVISRYLDLEDPDDYFGRVAYVRGQNPDDDFTSTFCKPSQFLGAMELLIRRARADVVVLSYFTGKNHWSKFDSGPNDTGRNLLSKLLSGSMFQPGSVEVVEVPRTNYASYGGFKARKVDELLLVARKRRGGPSESARGTDRGIPSVA